MPRPTRIQYPNAFYHVMNRGSGRQNIFHNHKYFLTFLDCLLEAHQRFGAVIHAYCLMSNHYHLILETPNANLSRIMRHINSIYTQRYNRLKKTDGPLLRGRFKAILIDEDNYLINLNRYIHRNPIKFVKNLEDYKWSSYPSYLNLSPVPKWLNTSKTLEILTNGTNDLKGYRYYVESDEIDKFIEEFYIKKAIPTVMGNEDFKKKICDKIISLHNIARNSININKTKINALPTKTIRTLNDHITSDQIIKSVAKVFEVTEDSIIERQIGRAKKNFPRKLGMYLCQEYAQNTLFEIQQKFNLKSSGSVGKAIFQVRKEIKTNSFKYQKELEIIKENLWLMEMT